MMPILSTYQATWPVADIQQPKSVRMRVSLAYVEGRVNVWLRFGSPVQERVLDRWRRVATFEPDAVCCRVKWLGNDYGTALWQLAVLQAPATFDDVQRVAGVVPGARILLRANGESQVKAVLAVIDVMEAKAIDPVGARLGTDCPHGSRFLSTPASGILRILRGRY